MNLYSKLQERLEQGRPVRVGVIGAGKFASMFLTQAAGQDVFHVVAVADLDVSRARDALRRTGWSEDRYSANSVHDALSSGKTYVTDDSGILIDSDVVDVVLEVTGNPLVGAAHALKCFEAGVHLVMVNVEADCMLGPLLTQKAKEAGVVYSMAYGDQPALICEMVDWARTTGFEVVAAGKGTRYLPEYHASTPETVWDYYGLTPEQAAHGGMNAKMFNSFLDGTKSAIEMAAVCNGTGLIPPSGGLLFPPVGVDDLPQQLIPASAGGLLNQTGTVEVVSSLHRDGSQVERDLRWGVYVTFRAKTPYGKDCFSEYGVRTDASGEYASLYRPYHMIGMELGVSIASAVLRGEPTGQSRDFLGDVVSVAKRDLSAGEVLDGEGGYTVYGRLEPASVSLANNALPIGLAHGARLRSPIKAGSMVTWKDVEVSQLEPAVQLRQQMEDMFRG